MDDQAFRDSMDEAGIKGFYHTSDDDKENSEGKRTYYRVLEIDASENEAQDKLNGVFRDVFHGLAMRALVETPPQEDSACATLITSLRELDNLHFAV